MTVAKAFDGIAEIIARLDPARILEITPPEELNDRVEELVTRKKDATISDVESRELERYLSLDLLISMAKIRARHLLGYEPTNS